MSARAVFFAVLFACVVVPVAAPCAQLELGIETGLGMGTHQESTGSAPSGVAVVPSLDAALRTGPWQLHVEGTPTLTGSVGPNSTGLRSFSLSYDNAALRYWLPGDRVAFGVGESLWNQKSLYLFPFASVDNASRGIGVRYEALVHLPVSRAQHLEFTLAESPAMQASLAYLLDTNALPFFTQPEHGTLSDTSLRDVVSLRNTDLQFGVRYLHLSMRFADGAPADRDDVWTVFAGYAVRLGR